MTRYHLNRKQSFLFLTFDWDAITFVLISIENQIRSLYEMTRWQEKETFQNNENDWWVSFSIKIIIKNNKHYSASIIAIKWSQDFYFYFLSNSETKHRIVDLIENQFIEVFVNYDAIQSKKSSIWLEIWRTLRCSSKIII